MFIDALLTGLTLGGMYALIAMGLTLQYGVARILNLAYGELLVAACFAAYALITFAGIGPLAGLFVIVPSSFVLSYGIYRILLMPLVRRARSRAVLEIDSILATFGLLFVIQGIMLAIFGGDYTSYAYLNSGVELLGTTIAANRLLVLFAALLLGGVFYFALTHTRIGTAIRAVAVDPEAASLVGIDVRWAAGLAFAFGGALAATGGVFASMFLTFNANIGVVFTMKALIIIIMGGVGNVLGALVAGLILGLAEAFVATFGDPGLTLAATYAIFLLALLFKPEGLFGRAAR
jgi:branched-chain amino acid transport system permease protein